jgi:phosphoglycolate phosphatase
MAIGAIIFDIDGVLADSREAVVHNTKTLMREFGFLVSDEAVEGLSTAHSAESVLLALAPPLRDDRQKLMAMQKRLAELTTENMGMVKPMALVASIPAFAAKYRLAAASNRKRSAAMVLEKFGVRKYFSTVVTSADAPAKPDPAMIRVALEKLGAGPRDAVFVGDNDEDRQAGEGAGVRTIILDGSDAAAVAAFLDEFLPSS